MLGTAMSSVDVEPVSKRKINCKPSSELSGKEEWEANKNAWN